MSDLLGSTWFLWGIGLMVVFPLAIIAINEIASMTRTGRWSAYASPLAWLHNAALPLLFVDLMLRLVAGYDSTHLAVKIADTALWIVAINFVLAATNVVFFGESGGAGLATRVPKLLLDLVRLFLVLVATSIIVSTVWGVDLGSLLTALGVGSLVIGLALQDTLGSVFSGLAMLSTRQIRVGDYVSVGGEEGVLTNMNWRTVTIRNGTGDDVIIPNSVVSREKVTVIGAEDGKRMMSADAFIAYDHPPDEVLSLMVEVARATRGIAHEPAPVSRLTRYEGTAVHYTLWFTAETIAGAATARHEFLSNLWYACQRDGIVFPAQYQTTVAIPASRRTPPAQTPEQLAREVEAAGALPRTAIALTPLMARASRRTYRSGETLLRQGEPLLDVLVVLSGEAQAVHTADADRKIAIDAFTAGQIILFKSAFRSGIAPHSIVARAALTCISVPVADFKAFLAGDLALARDIERTLSTRETLSNSAIRQSMPAELETLDVPDRVRYLKEMFRT